MYDPYERLANAIIERAVKDYRKLWHFNKDNYAKLEIIHFFNSQWFAILTRVNPEWLIEKLEEEANARRKKYIR